MERSTTKGWLWSAKLNKRMAVKTRVEFEAKSESVLLDTAKVVCQLKPFEK